MANPGELYQFFTENEDEGTIKDGIAEYVRKRLKAYKLHNYETIFLYDEINSINRNHSNSIYQATSSADCKKDIFLILHSGGGQIEPAYLISKTCKRLAKDKFVVVVPRRAKSAATLISLGADEIHLGLMSELGPIDPQIGGYPALGLTNALNSLAELSCKFPGSAEMFAKYLTENLNLRDLGYFERVNESASQYAERLLTNKKFPGTNNAETLADHFVNHYKDHGFVIDIDEASSLLGYDIVKQNTPEYLFANEIFSFIDFVSFFFGYVKNKEFSYVGDIRHGLNTKDKKE